MPRPRILFVEDNANTAMAMKVMLELKGYEVQLASTLAEARTKLRSPMAFHALISDLNLPDGSGAELLEISGIPAIALSGDVTEQTRQDSLQLGFKEYLAKPFETAELLEAIERILR